VDSFTLRLLPSLLTACPEILSIDLVFEKFLDLILWFRLVRNLGYLDVILGQNLRKSYPKKKNSPGPV